MKKVLFVSIIALSFMACGKKDVDAPTPAPAATNALVKKMTESLSVSNYEYDAQGRLSKIFRSSGIKTEYTYAANLITQTTYKANGDFDFAYKYELDAKGKAVKTTLSSNANYTVVHVYNSEGYLIKHIDNINGQSSGADYFYSNGNLDSIRYINGSNNWYMTRKKTYYTNQSNVLGDESNYGNFFGGKQNKNLLKSDLYISADGLSTNLTNYSYEFDAQGRVNKLTTTHDANLNIYYYEY